MDIKGRIEFIRSLFNMETGLNALRVSPIGFHEYMIEADDGSTYRFVG